MTYLSSINKRHLLTALLLTLLPIFGWAQLTEGSYYLRNKAAGLYVNAGGKWGTQAVLGSHAMMLQIEACDTDHDLYYVNMGYAAENDGYLGVSNNEVYVDMAMQTWTIQTGRDGCYTLKTPSGKYLAYSGTTLTVNQTTTNSNATQWELITKPQMLNTLLNLTAGSTADATFLISNPRFDHNCTESDWEGSAFSTGGELGINGNGNYCAEVWNSNFDVHQTLTNIPNGTYQLQAQGYYRYNNTSDNVNTVALTTHNNGTERLYARLYANNVSTPLQSIASEYSAIAAKGLAASNAGLPYSMTEAANAFSAGLYTDNTLTVTVTDHQLTIGIRKTQQDGCDWTIWDNFQLTLTSLGDNTGYNPYTSGDSDINFEDASPTHPVDATSLIKNADFQSTVGWHGGPVLGGLPGQLNAEKYNTTFDVWQTITDIPNGWYRLSAQGFYRYGDYRMEEHKSYYGEGWEENDANNIYAVYTIPYAVISRQLGLEKHLACLYANEVETGLPSPFDFAHTTATHTDDFETPLGWVPNTQTGASEAFSAGEYPVELMVPVTNGTLRLGVRKSLGYKYDWACWDHFQLFYLGQENLVYADDISLSATTVNMTLHEQRQLTAKALPDTASDPTLHWLSANSSVVSVDDNGRLTAKAVGTTTITVKAAGAEGSNLTKTITVKVNAVSASDKNLVINEIQVSNIDMFVDPSYNYGGYIELYNPTTSGCSLNGLYISDDPNNLKKCMLTANSGAVPAQGYGVVWFDHHNLNDGQPDFRLNMDGGAIYLSDRYGNLLVSQTYPAAVSRTSYARTTDGGSTWALTAYPTPGASNTGSKEWVSASGYTRLPMPEVSTNSRLFTGTLSVNVTIPSGARLYYTTDGTTPTDTHGTLSSKGQFKFTKTTTLRLRLYQKGCLPSPVKTCCYLLRDRDYSLPVISVVANPNDLYSDSLGVMVTGCNGIEGGGLAYRCNWNMDWDRPVNFTYISADRKTIYSQDAILKRFGGWSRSWYPFNFKLKARKEYEGLNYIALQPFEGKPYLKQKVWQLRNGGNDLYCRIKDVAIQQIIMTSGFYLDCQDYLPVHSFINGQYQGMLNLREPSNKHFAYANYGIDTDLIDQMELGYGILVNDGTDEAFQLWRQLAANATDPDIYRQICDMVDIDEFINYMATQVFLGGDDWPGNNCKAFKGADGKFHIVLFDVDQALRFDSFAFTHLTNNGACPLVEIFLHMLENDTFRRQWIDTFCIVAGSVFSPRRCAQIIDRLSDEMNPALALENLSTEPTASYIKAALSATRRDKMFSALAAWGPAHITTNKKSAQISTNTAGARLQINDVDVPTAQFEGALFAPVVLRATAPEGYTFNGWVNSKGKVVCRTADYDVSSLNEVTLTATFTPLTTDADLIEAIAMPVKVNEVSANNDIFINEWWKKSDWIELYNNTGDDFNAAGLYISDNLTQPLKYQVTDGGGVYNTLIPAGGHLVVWADQLESVSQLHSGFKLANDSGCVVVVSSSDALVANNEAYFSQHPDLSAFVDGMTYVRHRGDESVGRYPDGGETFYRMARPTINQSNSLLTGDPVVGHDLNLMAAAQEKFTLTLSTGWNWVSHPMHSPIGVGSMPSATLRIVGENHEAYRDTRLGMTGTLHALQAGALYKVQMSADDDFTCQGLHCQSNLPISLHTGWNWIGYPVDGAQSLTDALADYPAEEGETIMGQDGFSTFTNGRWQGSLSTLQQGKGYLLRTTHAKTLRFHTPTIRLRYQARMQHRSPQEQRYGVDSHAWPNVMGIIAQLQLDGTLVAPDRLTLLAYADKECRGVAQWIDSLAWLTVYGDGGEPLYFRAIDPIDGSVYQAVETELFTSGMTGTPQQPRLFTLVPYTEGPTDGTLAIPIHDRPAIEGIYTLSGVYVGRHTATLPPGLYILRHPDGTTRKLGIK